VVKAMIAQSHDFASTVNEETWGRLNRTLGEGINNGEGLRDLMARVETTMTGMTSKAPPLTWETEAPQSRAELIARTETTRAWGNGAHEAAMQSDAVQAKKWMSSLDGRTRAAHANAHGQEVAKDKPFVVGGEEGMYPGDFPSAANVCNCRCSVSYLTRKADPNAGPTAADMEPLGDAPGGGLFGSIGDAYDMSAATGNIGDAAREAIEAINSVHGVPELPGIEVEVVEDRSRNGGFRLEDGRIPSGITISEHNPHPMMTMAHESGHFLDHAGVGREGSFATASVMSVEGDVGEALRALRAALEDSEAHRILSSRVGVDSVEINIGTPRQPHMSTRDVNGRYVEYLMQPHEEFARAYAQYITGASGNAGMASELRSIRGPMGAYNYSQSVYAEQWTDRDFVNISSAFDNLFSALGWRR